MSYVRSVRFAGGLMAAVLGAGPVGAAVAPKNESPIAAREYRHPQLHIDNRVQRVEEQAAAARGSFLDALTELRVSSPAAYLDPRTGRFATLMPAEPLLPGTGEGNSVAWSDLGIDEPAGADGWKQAAWGAFVGYVEQHSKALGIDVAELAQPGNVTVHDDGAIVQIHAPRVIDGVRVRESYLTAVINHGNLVLFGAHNWGTVRVSGTPTLSEAEATQSLGSFLSALAPQEYRRKASLAIVPLSAGPLESLNAYDRGLDYRLVWVLSPRFAGDMGTWEALVDAHSGEMIAFTDTNHYQSVRRVQGGVYPVSNDLVPPDGVEQPGWPFPFADVTTTGGNFFTDTGGNLPVCATGSISSTLNGPFVRMADVCGPILHSGGGDLDFGVSAGTNCTTPGFGGLGNTHSSRTGFFELNKIIEQAKGQLPNNNWLQAQLTANMNINLTCNAFWNGSVNFYRQGGGCNNTGEIAAIFDHEWGHGMDNNDTTGSISNPGEGIADIYMALRLKESCVGRNFRNTNCGGYGNPCLSCTGVRDIDWAQRANNTPTTITWIDANCGAGPAPCGGGVHCEGSVYAETLWDLFIRDLPAAGYSQDTALEIATRTTYIGASPVTGVYQCVQGSGGCPATAAYLNFLAADDDNGNINNGTPHFGPLFAAFNRHGIACPTPATFTSGCALAPNAAPTVIATPEDKGARLSWAGVPGGVKYRVYRTEGVFGCNFGKVLLGETFGTTWSDTGLQNGRQYFYTVAAVGLSNTCLGPMSSCTTVTPVAGGNLTPDPASATALPITGDGDPFVDNCETVTVGFNVANTGTGAQTNVRVAAVQPLSHPGMQVLSLGTPTPSLASCATAVKAFNIRAVDLVPDAVVRLRVDVTSDELFPGVRSFIVQFANTEGNNNFVATRTYDFEAGAEGWTTVTGTFNRTNAAPGGAGGARHLLLPVLVLPGQPVRRGAVAGGQPDRHLDAVAAEQLRHRGVLGGQLVRPGQRRPAEPQHRRAHRGQPGRWPALQRERRRRRLRPRSAAGLGGRQPHLGRQQLDRRCAGLGFGGRSAHPPQHQVRDRRGGQRIRLPLRPAHAHAVQREGRRRPGQPVRARQPEPGGHPGQQRVADVRSGDDLGAGQRQRAGAAVHARGVRDGSRQRHGDHQQRGLPQHRHRALHPEPDLRPAVQRQLPVHRERPERRHGDCDRHHQPGAGRAAAVQGRVASARSS